MLYYSEKAKKFYKTEDELVSAEKEYDKAAKEANKKLEVKKNKAKAVEEAYKHAQDVRKTAGEMINAADKEYYDLRNDFIKEYGSFHMSYSDGDAHVEDAAEEINNVLENIPWFWHF